MTRKPLGLNGAAANPGGPPVGPIAKPTPGPWAYKAGEYPHEGYFVITADHAGMTPRSPLAKVSMLGDEEAAEADAALIVRLANLYFAGQAQEKAKQDAIRARGDLPPDLDYGLSEGERAAALMMNALAEENAAMAEAIRLLLPAGWGDDATMDHMPGVKLARTILERLDGAEDDDDGGYPPPCTDPGGHRFECTGTAYGGDDERWMGEGRSLCIHCGADGDG